MKFTTSFAFETRTGAKPVMHEARVTYTIIKGRAQTYGQPEEPPHVGPDLDFEINLSGTWCKCSDDFHDFLLSVIGDDMDWLLEDAREQALYERGEV
jgi:hypothetical protein